MYLLTQEVIMSASTLRDVQRGLTVMIAGVHRLHLVRDALQDVQVTALARDVQRGVAVAVPGDRVRTELEEDVDLVTWSAKTAAYTPD